MKLKPATELIVGELYYSAFGDIVMKLISLEPFKHKNLFPNDITIQIIEAPNINYYSDPNKYVLQDKDHFLSQVWVEDNYFPPKNIVPNSPNIPGAGFDNPGREYTPLAY